MAPDGSSSNTAQYASLRRVNYAVGKVEDYLVNARVPAGKIGFLYPRTTDVWTIDQGMSNFGKERMGLYLVLRHLGYPVDVLTEQDAVEKKLGGYTMLFLNGSHIRRDAAQGLVQWVKDGGRLFLDAGSFTYDEYNRPLNLDTALGISRQPYVEKENVGREYYEGPGLKNIEAITYQGKALESVCGIQKLTGAAPANARVLATFADQSPAVLMQPLGKGKVVFCGAFPGLAYLKSGVIAMFERNKSFAAEKKAVLSYNPPSFNADYQALIAATMEGIAYQPPVTTDNYLVEANLLENTNGLVITLANWTGQPLTACKISLPAGKNYGKPFAGAGEVKAAVANGRLNLTLDLQEADFIVIPFTKK